MQEPPLFELGRVVGTPAVVELLTEAQLHWLVNRHVTGDDGSMSPDDMESNREARREGDRIVSCYTLKEGVFYIVTEWDRLSTTVMLREEY